MRRSIVILGVPMDLGQSRRGVDMGPSAMRCTGFESALRELGYDVTDLGDVRVPVVESLSKVEAVPGFVRLPTEDEWEYCARGGLEAMQAGTFDDRLPFAAAKADEFAWHLGNAKHQLRPVGLRQPDAHGFHDLFGNAQEMTSGLFRPEVWQGKPGGVAVRHEAKVGGVVAQRQPVLGP